MYGLGFKEAYEDVVFEAGKDYYYYVYLVAKDVMEQGMELGPDGIRLFSVDNPPKINVGHGVEVNHVIPIEVPKNLESRAISGPASAEMLVLAKVSIPKPAPSTADMNPGPWVWTMVLALGLVFTAVYYEIVDIRRFNQGK